jgi:pimeloyl-ACP methyl ester carboxylesterase
MKKTLAYKIENPSNSQNTVVLLHGFCESKTIWGAASSYLSEEYQAISLDLAGFGDSPSWDFSYSIEDLADGVHETLQELGIEKAVFIGHSLGGYVSLAYAEKYPQNLQGLCLVNSLVFADTEEKKANRNKLIESLNNYGTAPFLKTFFHGLLSPNSKERCEQKVQILAAEASQIRLDTLIRTIEAMRDRKDYTTVLENLEVPTCFIVGGEDPVISREQNDRQTSINTKGRKISNYIFFCGHLAMIESKGLTLSIIGYFSHFCFRAY